MVGTYFGDPRPLNPKPTNPKPLNPSGGSGERGKPISRHTGVQLQARQAFLPEELATRMVGFRV